MNKIVEKNIQNPNNTLAGISKLFNVGYKEITEEEEASGLCSKSYFVVLCASVLKRARFERKSRYNVNAHARPFNNENKQTLI